MTAKEAIISSVVSEPAQMRLYTFLLLTKDTLLHKSITMHLRIVLQFAASQFPIVLSALVLVRLKDVHLLK